MGTIIDSGDITTITIASDDTARNIWYGSYSLSSRISATGGGMRGDSLHVP